MKKQIEAMYERGILRPLKPLEMPEGTRLTIYVVARQKSRPDANVAEIPAEIAALSLESASDPFSAREHDSILCPKK
jgi:predicted DNA-binding antitoxin AbrB/MazE fold protein